MKNRCWGRAFLGGVAGTPVMTAVMMMASAMGMPKMDVAAILGGMLSKVLPIPNSFAWVVGLMMHLVIGSVVLSSIFVLAYKYLPLSSPLGKGFSYGTVVWLMAEVLVMPMMGAGLFSLKMPQGATLAIASLLGHLIYGVVLASVYGPQPSVKAVNRGWNTVKL